ncbi:MAG: hypothetical protein WKF96_20435, partial [Solirubrobacteraceae bacterium]
SASGLRRFSAGFVQQPPRQAQRSCQLLAAVHFKNSCSGADDAGLVLLDAADRLRSDDATHAYSR